MFTIFKVINVRTNQVYYGYSACDDMGEIRHQFLTNANGHDSIRGDVRVLNGCGNESLSFEVYDVCDSETEAHIIRNEARVLDVDSVSGPTAWPIETHKKAIIEFRPRADAIYNKQLQLKCKTARKAYAAGLWTKQQIQSLLNSFNHITITTALDTLTPIEFTRQYQKHMTA